MRRLLGRDPSSVASVTPPALSPLTSLYWTRAGRSGPGDPPAGDAIEARDRVAACVLGEDTVVSSAWSERVSEARGEHRQGPNGRDSTGRRRGRMMRRAGARGNGSFEHTAQDAVDVA